MRSQVSEDTFAFRKGSRKEISTALLFDWSGFFGGGHEKEKGEEACNVTPA
jgi:hypothetical protein